MRLLLCTKSDLTSVITLNTLLPRLGRYDVRVLVSTATDPCLSVPEAEQLRFFERDLPFDLLFPLIDQGRAGSGRWRTLEGLKRHYGIAVEHTDALTNPTTMAGIFGFKPDLILSTGFDRPFAPEILALPSLGVLNIHPGCLPRYAGARPLLRTLIDEGERIGCTLHLVENGVPSGRIVAEDSVPVTPDRSFHSYNLEVYLLGAQLFLDALGATERGRPLTGVARFEDQRCTAEMTGEDQFRRLRALGIPAVKPADYCRLVQRFLPDNDAVTLPSLSPLSERLAA